MSADFNPLDTRGRAKVLGIIQQLADFGMSPEEIQNAFQSAQTAGRGALQDYYNTAGLAIGQQFQPTFQGARDFLGANPLLADSGYANRLNRQILTALGGRLTSDYGQAASNMAGQNVDFYRNLFNQRFNQRGQLAGQAYQTLTGLPKKPSTGSQIAGFGGRVLGTGLGLLAGGPAGAAIGSQLDGQLAGPRPGAASTDFYQINGGMTNPYYDQFKSNPKYYNWNPVP